MNKSNFIFFVLTILLTLQSLSAQPVHRRLFYYHPLTNAIPAEGEQITNTDGKFISTTGWKATNTNSQLKIDLSQLIPFEGTLMLDVSNFDPAHQATNLKHQIINLYSVIHPSNNKYLFQTDNAWWNIRTYHRYSLGEGMAGFRFQSAPNHIDSRTTDDVMLKTIWDSTKTYTFKVTWDHNDIYCFVDGELISTLPHENQIRAYKIILLGRDNLIWGYCGQPGPVYSNLRIYIEGDPQPDDDPPKVESVAVACVNKVYASFNKALDQKSAENLNNYSITPKIKILKSNLLKDLKTVELLTTAHRLNRFYSLTIQNLKDRLDTADALEDTTIGYQFTREFVVDGISRKNYSIKTKRIGDPVYSDRPYLITQLPESLNQLTWIETANNDKDLFGSEFISFYVNKRVTLYIAYDTQYTDSLPTWLLQWQETNMTIESEDTAYKIYKKEYNPGTITLGANTGGSSSSMYLILMDNYTDDISPSPPEIIGVTKPMVLQ